MGSVFNNLGLGLMARSAEGTRILAVSGDSGLLVLGI